MSITSIWSTPECDAWSRDLDYDSYVSLHKAYNDKNIVSSKPVSKKTYYMLCAAFESQMAEDFLKDEKETLDTGDLLT